MNPVDNFEPNRPCLTHAGKVPSKLSTKISRNLGEVNEAKSAKQSFASKYLKFGIFTSLYAFCFAVVSHF